MTIFGALCALAALAAAADALALRVCHHNDFHGRYEQINKYYSQCEDEDAAAGKCFSSAMRLAEAMGSAACDLRIHAGDFVQGSTLDTLYGKDIAISAYKAMHYDIAAFGNHEFNKGPQDLIDTVTATAPGLAWLVSNVEIANTPPAYNVSTHLDLHGICWVGALTPTTKDTSNPGDTVTISDPVEAMVSAMDGCAQTDNVIAVTHLGYDKDIEACHAIPQLDFVIGAHSHTDLDMGNYPYKVVREDGSVCWIVTAFAFGRYLGFVDIEFEEGKLQMTGHAYLPMDGRIPLEPGVEAMVQHYRGMAGVALMEVVGTASEAVDGEKDSCMAGDCQMGNLICDAMLEEVGARALPVVCIQNTGDIRGSFVAGDVTFGDVRRVLPYDSVHATVDITGDQLFAALENGLLALTDKSIGGRFPQLGGMVVEYDSSKEPNSHVQRVVVAGVEVTPTSMYTLVTTDFVVGGGDGYDFSSATNVETSGRPVYNLLKEYVAKYSPFTPPASGRLVDVAGAR